MFIRAVAFPMLLTPSFAFADGAQLYLEHCADCHGEHLEGEKHWKRQNPDGTMPAPPHDASGHTWHHADDMLFDYTKLGGEEALRQMGVTGVSSAMPGFAGVLSDEEIIAILLFLKSSWPPELLEYQSHITEMDK